MQKKLVRHGNSWALVIDKPILDLLKIDPETVALDISPAQGGLLIQPPGVDRAKMLDNALQRTNEKFEQALRNLAS
ncbi:MAG: antitoxin MazE [Candidatus Sumerlaeota bacterium]|nr:antitoxin MazE [Candidatus Sumerlaeota bacterium]